MPLDPAIVAMAEAIMDAKDRGLDWQNRVQEFQSYPFTGRHGQIRREKWMDFEVVTSR